MFLRRFSWAPIIGSILLLLALVFAPQFISAESFATDDPSFVATSIIIGNSGTIDLSITPGQFVSSNPQPITVATNNYTGYTMTIAPSSGSSTDLVNSSVSGAVIPSISDSTTASDFATLSYAAYGLSIDGGENFIPIEDGSIVKTTNSATDSTTGTFGLTLGGKALSTTPAGTYAKSFTLNVTANAPTYRIFYNANAGTDTIANMPSSPQITGNISGMNLALASEIPSRTGYTFLGWDTNSAATTATYSAGFYPLDQTTDNQITLYAIWGTNTYSVTIKPTTGISNVSLDGVSCTDYSGCTIEGLIFDHSYQLTANLLPGYHFESWENEGYGSINNPSSALTEFTVGSGNSTITPTIRANQIPLTVNYDTGVQEILIDGVIVADGTTIGLYYNVPYTIEVITDAMHDFLSWSVTAGEIDSITSYSTTYTIGLEASTLSVSTKTIVYMQEFASERCGRLTEMEEISLKDSRDEETYSIVKLPDGRCWMTKNLRLDFSDSSIIINEDNTNNPASTFVIEANTHPASSTGMVADNMDSLQYNTENLGGVDCPTGNCDIYGVQYNFYTATAGHGASTMEEGDAVGDICPSGWRIPRIRDWTILNQFLNNGGSSRDAYLNAPVNFQLAGQFDATWGYRGNLGRYWTSTKTGTNPKYANAFSINPDAIVAGTDNWWSYSGRNIRCLAIPSSDIVQEYTLSFDANGGINAPSSQTVVGSDSGEFTINALVPTRQDYVFVGWADSSTNPVHRYRPKDKLVVRDVATTLYAIWEPSSGSLQTWNDCSMLEIGQSVYLTDIRDNQGYLVSKYKMTSDGSISACWTSNLDFGAAELVVGSIDYTNTNLPNDSRYAISKAEFDTWEDGIDQATYTSPQFAHTQSFDSYGNNYGTLYNYAATSANTYTYSKETGEGNALYDICPSGWRLPTGGSEGEYTKLIVAYNGLASHMGSDTSPTGAEMMLIMQRDLRFTLGGYFDSAAPVNQGWHGYFWTSTISSTSSMNVMEFMSPDIYPSISYARERGASIRCIKQ